jgi:membrane protein
MSSALSFRTILALVPTLVLAFLVVNTATGGLKQGKAYMRKALDTWGLSHIYIPNSQPPEPGAAGPVEAEVRLVDKIEELVGNVEQKLTLGRLGPVGLALLAWSALTLLTTMERSLNRIFGARQPRSLARRTLLYWSVLTLGPLLLVVVNVLAHQAAKPFATMPLLSWVIRILSGVGPVLVAILLLAALYKLMPNTPVRIESALGGAVIAVILWLVAKWALGLYVTNAASNLYGALGLIPLFLMWLSASWWIFLFGAQLAHTAANLNRLQAAELAARLHLGPLDSLAATLAVALPFTRGLGPVPLSEIARRLNLPESSVQGLLERLCERGILACVQSEPAARYVLARPAARVNLFELLELTGGSHPGSGAPQDPEIGSALAAVRNRAAQEQCTLADLIRD